jgi:hypothetical protein
VKADLLIVWAWEHDADFVRILCECCERWRVSVCLAGARELAGLPAKLNSGDIAATAAIDRAWDWGGEYAHHTDAIRQCVPFLLNDYALVTRAWSKPAMHYALISRGLRAPHMLVLPSAEAQPHLAPVDLVPLGKCFSIKGAHSGGSGVLAPACFWDDVLRNRVAWPQDETILQTWVAPRLLGRRRAWFRVFYACGRTFACWADDLTHVQTVVTPAEASQWRLDILRGMAQQIAGVCGLNVFSTEIALDENNLWQVVDYVNEPCDYRLKSTAPNGVPDEVVRGVADSIAAWAGRRARQRGDSSPA